VEHGVGQLSGGRVDADRAVRRERPGDVRLEGVEIGGEQ